MSYFDFDRMETISTALKKCEKASREMLEETEMSDPMKCVLCSQLATIMALEAVADELSSFAFSLRRIGV